MLSPETPTCQDAPSIGLVVQTWVGHQDGNGNTIAVLDVLSYNHHINFLGAWNLPPWDLVVLWLE